MSLESHKRVLVVDDDADTVRFLRAVLTQRGLTVETASDGDEALALLGANRYSVILLDLIMPGRDGFDVLAALKSQSVISPSVVLVITGAERHILDRLDSTLIHGIVRKPFDAVELGALVAACAEIKGRGTFETMALAMLSGAPLLSWLQRL
jgi:two-component system sensor histidine kinase/response regulator